MKWVLFGLLGILWLSGLRAESVRGTVALEEERWHVRAGVAWQPSRALWLGLFLDQGFARRWRTRTGEGAALGARPGSAAVWGISLAAGW